jgi:hypothetical protein
MAVLTTFSSGRWDTVCTTVTVERHLACQCNCKQTPDDCDSSVHLYDAASCACQCKDRVGRAGCGAGKKWDERACSCGCSRDSWKLCSTGYTFDFRESW